MGPNRAPCGSTVLSHIRGNLFIRDIVIWKNAVDKRGEERDEGLPFIHFTTEGDSGTGMLPKWESMIRQMTFMGYANH
jgi:hypothetical protein